MDYVALRQLAARHAWALDSGADNGYAFADLFTVDGEFVHPDAKGREQLATLARGGRRGPMFVSHFAMNHVIEPSPAGAVGTQYVIEIDIDDNGQPAARRGGNATRPARGGAGARGAPADQWALVGRRGGAPTSIGGRYEDVYVRTSAGWRFKRREFVPARSGARADATRKAASSATIPPRALKAPEPDNQNRSALSALDYLEIEQLVSRYGHALDSGFGQGDNGAAYAGLFAPDGIFYSRGRPYQGEQLYQLARDQPHGPDYVRHFLTNHVIEPSPDGATGKEYLVVLDIGQNGQPGSVYLGGHYEDVYVKTPDGWRFKTRRSFGSVSGPQQPRSKVNRCVNPY
jgi:hypothetical protein